MTYKLIDLFCGAGGMTLGFVDKRFGGGFEPILALDNDEAAIETHSLNFEGEAVVDNIDEWIAKGAVPAADVVIGGPPCQGFSLLNKARQGDERRALWEPYLDVVELSGAKMFVMENVAELIRSQELEDIKERSRTMGFELVSDVLNTADFGVPQTRRRTIIIAWKRDEIGDGVSLPTPTHTNPQKTDGTRDKLTAWTTVREALKGLPRKPKGTEIGERYPLDLHFGRNPTAKSQLRYRAVPPGGNRFDLQKNAPELTPQCWIKKTSGGTDLFGRLWWDRPSVTIRTEFFKPEKGRYLHPVEHRPITHREAARIMGFPDNFRFKGSKTEIARQIGNAIPPQFAGVLSKVVKTALDKCEQSCAETDEKTKKAA